jgi:hypothetical protein
MPVFLLKRFATFLATLTLPIPLRLLLAAQPKLVTPVLLVNSAPASSHSGGRCRQLDCRPRRSSLSQPGVSVREDACPT